MSSVELELLYLLLPRRRHGNAFIGRVCHDSRRHLLDALYVPIGNRFTDLE